MEKNSIYAGGENFNLREMLLTGRSLNLNEKTLFFENFLNDLRRQNALLNMRCIDSEAGRSVTVINRDTEEKKNMLMFGSNNYLGLASHPLVKEKVSKIIKQFGAGIGGPPLLNGYTSLHRQLEERLAAFKGAEDAVIFSSGYAANVGLVSGLTNPDDIVIYDAYSHASFCDGIKLSGVKSFRFPHNNTKVLKQKLDSITKNSSRDIYIGIEGVYSMDGDTAPLNEIISICKNKGAVLLLDDAHGTGVMGEKGKGTAEFYGVENMIDITMGTFSKTFAATGAFVAASKPVTDYLRYFARSYMFSASLPPAVIATVLAGLDVIENEPGLIARLRSNVEYAKEKFNDIGFDIKSRSPIIPLPVPRGMDIRKAGLKFHENGLFVNSVEYPAVPVSQQRFRISIMAIHRKEDIDMLAEAVEEIWEPYRNELYQESGYKKVQAA